MNNVDEKPDFAKAEGTDKYNPSDDKEWQEQFPKKKPEPYKSKGEKAKYFIILVLIAFFVIMIGYAIGKPGPYYSWAEGKTAIGAIKAAADAYAARNNGDISGLDDPKGTKEEGFVEGSLLLEKLRLEPRATNQLEYFKPEEFSLEFVTDGKNGHYIIKLQATGGGGNSGVGPDDGTITYNSKTRKWEEDY